MSRVGIFALLVVALSGCAASRPSFDGASRHLTFDSGAPLVDAEARAVARGDSVKLRVTWGVVPASLIRTHAPGTLRAILQTDVVARSAGSAVGMETYSRTDTLTFEDELAATSFQHRLFEHDVPAAPGNYEVVIRVEDLTSGAASENVVDVEVPERASDFCTLAVREGGTDARSVVSFHIPSGDRPIEIVADVWGTRSDLKLSLVRLESDTSAADPPFGLSRTRGALSMRGVRGENADTVDTRAVATGGRETVVPFAPQVPGIYRATCTGTDDVLASREFAVRHPGFPAVDRLPVMVEALTYLATDREMSRLRASASADELKHRFDAFWAERMPDRGSAARLLERYYSRVEEANLLFSGVKEGWKTDRGMIYIMRGPPLFTEQQIDRETWYYTYSDVNPADVYSFERIIITGVDAIGSHVVLTRSPVYDYEWRRLLDRWRSGAIL